MIKNVKLSVIIPVYNSSKYIVDLLDNLLYKQTFKDVEIICVNDGSTDNSKELIESFAEKDDRIICINQDNKGAGVARNNGFKYANGEYVIWLDSDDLYFNNYFERMYETIIYYKVDIVNCLFEIEDYRSNITQNKLGFKNLPINKVISVYDYPNILCDLRVNPATKIYRSEFIRENHLEYMSTKSSNDVSFAIQAKLLATGLVCLDEELFKVRRYILSSSITSNRFMSSENTIDAYIVVSNWMKNKNFNKKILENYLKQIKHSLSYNLKFGYKKIFFDKFCVLITGYPFNLFTNEEINKIFYWDRNMQIKGICKNYASLIETNDQFNTIENTFKDSIFLFLNCDEISKIIKEYYPYNKRTIKKSFLEIYHKFRKTFKRLCKKILRKFKRVIQLLFLK
jgi:glycosyltransferase involved in cell wall biosynthesis